MKATNSDDEPVPINTRVVGSNISLPSLFLWRCKVRLSYIKYFEICS